jgi:hypothetical protein
MIVACTLYKKRGVERIRRRETRGRSSRARLFQEQGLLYLEVKPYHDQSAAVIEVEVTAAHHRLLPLRQNMLA